MEIHQALESKKGDCIAFVGAGGKTSAMFALARELPKPVVLTTTTHLGTWQAQDADRHTVVFSPEDVDKLEFESDQILLLTGPQDANNRLTSPDKQVLKRIHEQCKQKNISLLIEADGAKQRCLKAPADYEPVIPAWIDTVIVVAGLQGLGKPLTEEWVHRPEVFSALSGRALDDQIEVEDVVKVLGSPAGGLKGIPGDVNRFLFLSQADEPITTAQASRIAQLSLENYSRVMIGKLDHQYDEGPVFAAYSQVAGVVLAAGGSKRLGAPKQLLEWQGEPFVSKVVRTGLESGLSSLVVVTGAEKDLVEASLHGLTVEMVHNPDWAEGQAGSMQIGLSAIPEACDAVLFLLSDQPQVSPILIRQLIERFYQHRKPITAPLIDGMRSNPVLFSRVTFDQLRCVTGDQGGRAVIQQFEVDWLPWMDDRVRLDVDKEGELERLIHAYFSK